ncbi:MAG: hypothetical protein AAF307_07370 [Pseudomonadota bacterium]
MHSFPTAKDVSEHLLARTGRALLTGDAALFESCLTFPNVMQSFDGQVLCETPEHFREIFAQVMRHMRRSGVTEMSRHCVAAAYRDATTVEATHECRMLAGTRVTQPAYPVFSVLKRVQGLWKISYSAYAIIDAPDHSQALGTTLAPAPYAARA